MKTGSFEAPCAEHVRRRSRAVRRAASLLSLAAVACLASAAYAQAPPVPWSQPGAQPQPWGAQPQPYGAQPQPYGAQPVGATAAPPHNGAPLAQPSTGYDPSLSAGGLAPPPPLENTGPAPEDRELEDELERSRDEDSGRGLSWFWIEAQGGYEHVGLRTFDVDEQALTAGFVDTSANGGFVSAGLGARLIFLTLGARARLGLFDQWQLGRVGGEIGLRIPLGPVEPRFDLGVGYAALGNLDSSAGRALSIDGLYARAGAGLDFYLGKYVSIGGQATFDFMALTRPGLSPSEIADLQTSGDVDAGRAELLAAEGSGYGSTFGLAATLGLHF